MNYYQEANQPEIKENNVRVFDTVEQMLEAIGMKEFRCSACDGISKYATGKHIDFSEL